jgi:hypothetical protein
VRVLHHLRGLADQKYVINVAVDVSHAGSPRAARHEPTLSVENLERLFSDTEEGHQVFQALCRATEEVIKTRLACLAAEQGLRTRCEKADLEEQLDGQKRIVLDVEARAQSAEGDANTLRYYRAFDRVERDAASPSAEPALAFYMSKALVA